MKDAIDVMLMAMVAVIIILVSNVSLAASDFDEGYYNECMLKNVKPGVDRSATGAIMQACKFKATPKQCRALSDEHVSDPYDLLALSDRSKCVEACKTESWYSRNLGDCSTG